LYSLYQNGEKFILLTENVDKTFLLFLKNSAPVPGSIPGQMANLA